MTTTQHADEHIGTNGSAHDNEPILQTHHLVREDGGYSARENALKIEIGQCKKEITPDGGTSSGNHTLMKSEGAINNHEAGNLLNELNKQSKTNCNKAGDESVGDDSFASTNFHHDILDTTII